MPFFNFKCDVCGFERDTLRGVSRIEEEVLCQECGGSTTVIGESENNLNFVVDPHAGGKFYPHEFHSDALGMAPSQVAEHKRLFPEIPIDSECRPVFTNFKDHDNYLTATGFSKQKQRVRHVVTSRYRVTRNSDGELVGAWYDI